MGYKVSAQDLGAISLNESDMVASVLQNIAIILSTRKGTSPLARDFGLPMQFVDKPIPVARTLMVAEIQEAITQFEPRAALVDVSFAIDENAPGKLIPTVEIEVNLDG